MHFHHGAHVQLSHLQTGIGVIAWRRSWSKDRYCMAAGTELAGTRDNRILDASELRIEMVGEQRNAHRRVRRPSQWACLVGASQTAPIRWSRAQIPPS